VPAEHTGYGGEHAGPVGDLEVEVVLAGRVVDGPDGHRGQRPHCRARALAEVGGGVDEITQHRTCGRIPTGPAPVEHEVLDGRAFDEHRVVALAHAGEWVTERHHRRMHSYADRAVDRLDDGEQLHDV